MSKRLSQFEDFSAFQRFTGADYLASRNLVAYAADKLLLRSLSDGAEEQVTAGGQGEGNPRFCPDGRKLLFVSSTQAGRQVYTYDLESKQVCQVTSMKTPVLDPVWSPDGRKILFASPSGGGGQPVRVHSDEAVVIENFNYKFDGSGFHTPDSHMHLYIADVETGETLQVTGGDFDYMHHNWSADGNYVVCCSGRFRPKSESIGMDLLLIRAEEQGEVIRLTQDLWIVSYPNPLRPVATPDGKYIITGCLNMPAALPDDIEQLTYPEVYLYRIALDGSGYEQIFQPSGECYQCVQFPYNAFCGWGFDKLQLTDGGEYILFLAGWQGECRLYKIPVSGGSAQTLASGKQALNGISRVQGGKTLIALSSPTRPEWYEVLDIELGGRTDTGIQSCPALLADAVAYSQPEDIYIDTLDGDSSVQGWVMPPQGLDPEKKYPAILYIHGGPQPFYTYGFTLEHQCFAGAGFAVITCNARGSSYGWNHQDIEKAYDGRAYMDFLQIVDEACRKFPWIDRDRIGVTGGSYGGYMVNYMATHCKRFKAYITQRSVSNNLITYASSDMQGSSKAYPSFEEFMVNQLKDSTVSYAERIDKPLLILHGMDDLRTPVEGAHQLFVAVKDTHPDLPVKMVLYPHTSHDQPSHPQQQLHYYHEMVAWFQKYL